MSYSYINIRSIESHLYEYIFEHFLQGSPVFDRIFNGVEDSLVGIIFAASLSKEHIHVFIEALVGK